MNFSRYYSIIVLAVAMSVPTSAAMADSKVISASASSPKPSKIVSAKVDSSQSTTFDVFKSPTCGCCEQWIAHLQSNGVDAVVHHLEDLNAVKTSHHIAPQYRSCHTAVSADGYVFEGHVPFPIIQRFLAEKPKGAIGLAVPGMPTGSPGMEMGENFTPYDVLLLAADGSSRVYAHIASAADQHADNGSGSKISKKGAP